MCTLTSSHSHTITHTYPHTLTSHPCTLIPSHTLTLTLTSSPSYLHILTLTPHTHTLTYSSKRFVVPAEDKVALEAKEMVREWRDKLTDLYVVRGAFLVEVTVSLFTLPPLHTSLLPLWFLPSLLLPFLPPLLPLPPSLSSSFPPPPPSSSPLPLLPYS